MHKMTICYGLIQEYDYSLVQWANMCADGYQWNSKTLADNKKISIFFNKSKTEHVTEIVGLFFFFFFLFAASSV